VCVCVCVCVCVSSKTAHRHELTVSGFLCVCVCVCVRACIDVSRETDASHEMSRCRCVCLCVHVPISFQKISTAHYITVCLLLFFFLPLSPVSSLLLHVHLFTFILSSISAEVHHLLYQKLIWKSIRFRRLREDYISMVMIKVKLLLLSP